jgi:arylsulfatase
VLGAFPWIVLMKTQPVKFALSGDGLCVGDDSSDAVSAE